MKNRAGALEKAIPTDVPQGTRFGQQVASGVRSAHVKAAVKADAGGSAPVPARFAAALAGGSKTTKKRKG